MNLLCLAPTFGRSPEVLANTIACFEHQTYLNKHLLLYDDLGNVQEQHGDRWKIISTTKREPNLPAKYHAMLQMAQGIKETCDYDAVVVWDDDDVYLPWHLEAAAHLLKSNVWVYPTYVYSTYTGDLELEKVGGNFHGSLIMSRVFFEEIGRWREGPEADFDQEIIVRCSKGKGTRGDVLDVADPSYVFRWADSGGTHCQAGMSDPNWYQNYKPGYAASIGQIQPAYDPVTAQIMDELCEHPDTSGIK